MAVYNNCDDVMTGDVLIMAVSHNINGGTSVWFGNQKDAHEFFSKKATQRNLNTLLHESSCKESETLYMDSVDQK